MVKPSFFLIFSVGVMAGVIALGSTSCFASAVRAEFEDARISSFQADETMIPEVEIEASVRRGSIGKFVPSFYWIAQEPKHDRGRIHELLDAAGRLIARVSSSFLKRLKMEGTGRLADGRVINFGKRWRGRGGAREWRWQICGEEAPYGLGRDNVPLAPFRSVAVDPRLIPLGSKLYIPAARGARLPNGKVHDGIFQAVDIGDMIQRRKIDIFTAFGDQSWVFGAVGMQTGKPVEVYMVRRGHAIFSGAFDSVAEKIPNETSEENQLYREPRAEIEFGAEAEGLSDQE